LKSSRAVRLWQGKQVARGIVLVVSLIALAGCGGISFPSSAKSAFLNACEQNSPAPTCTCMLNFIQGHVSVATFIAGAAELKSGTVPKFVTAAAASCRNNGGSTVGTTT
jgi:hypothetical protein